MIVLGSRAAGKRASRVSRGALFFLPQDFCSRRGDLSVHIDLNADVGEATTPLEELVELALLDLVSSINVACGVHAGDRGAMRRLVSVAVALGLNIGAHPGYADPAHLGRRALLLPPADVRQLVREQVAALAALAVEQGAGLTHVKPHGALYNQAARDHNLARAIARGVRRLGGGVTLVGLATSPVFRAAALSEGVPFAGEAFVDRAYEQDGTLVRRGSPGALLETGEAAAQQAVAIATKGRVTARDGISVSVSAETLCLHGDNKNAVEIARAVRFALEAAGVKVQALGPHGPA